MLSHSQCIFEGGRVRILTPHKKRGWCKAEQPSSPGLIFLGPSWAQPVPQSRNHSHDFEAQREKAVQARRPGGLCWVTQECAQFSWFSLEKAGAAKLEPLDWLLQQWASVCGGAGCRWRTALPEGSLCDPEGT